MTILVRTCETGTSAIAPAVTNAIYAATGTRVRTLNVNEFASIDEARQRIEAWRIDYNEHRPHGALGHLTPSEYVKTGQKRSAEAAVF